MYPFMFMVSLVFKVSPGLGLVRPKSVNSQTPAEAPFLKKTVFPTAAKP